MGPEKETLHLNQNNLQDFLDCPRRFQLRVLEAKSWPAASTSSLPEVEQSILLGNRFHQICQQYFTGVSRSQIELTILDPTLLEMWDSFLAYAGSFQGKKLFVEQLLQVPLLGFSLVAKFDLLVELENHYLIVDWKTSPQKPPLPVLAERVQSFLYPYILVQAGGGLFQTQGLDPETIRFSYFYPLSSEPEVSFDYSKKQHSFVEDKLTSLVSKISEYRASDISYPLTAEISHCRYCSYRSLCERGSRAGNYSPELDQEDLNWEEIHFDLDQISELEF